MREPPPSSSSFSLSRAIGKSDTPTNRTHSTLLLPPPEFGSRRLPPSYVLRSPPPKVFSPPPPLLDELFSLSLSFGASTTPTTLSGSGRRRRRRRRRGRRQASGPRKEALPMCVSSKSPLLLCTLLSYSTPLHREGVPELAHACVCEAAGARGKRPLNCVLS